MQIEHDKEEPKIDRRPESFRLLFFVIAIGWAALLYSTPMDWRSIAAGFATGAVFMLWASVRFKHLW